MSKIKNLLKLVNEAEENKWEKTDDGLVFGDEASLFILNYLKRLSKKVLGVPLDKTYFMQSDYLSKLYYLWDKANKRSIVGKDYYDEGASLYRLFKLTINGHTVIGSDWDGVIWIISKDKFDL